MFCWRGTVTKFQLTQLLCYGAYKHRDKDTPNIVHVIILGDSYEYINFNKPVSITKAMLYYC